MEKTSHNQSEVHSEWILPGIAGLGILSGVGYLFNFKLHQLVPASLVPTPIHFYIFLFALLSGIYLLAIFLILKGKAVNGHSPRLLWVILGFAIAFRLFLVPTEPSVLSKDMYRYIWDGRVQVNDINPYLYPPAAEELQSLQDQRIFPHINRKDEPTIYPAGAQLFFRTVYLLAGNHIAVHKGSMVFFDILALLALAALLRIYGFEPVRLIVYAWNPLVIFEIAYSGHLEGLTVFLIVAALYLYARRKTVLGTMVLALCTAVKLYPALLLAAVLNRGERIKGIAVFFATIALIYLPYVAAGSKISGFLPIYLENPYESFNLGFKSLVMHMFPNVGYDQWSHLFLVALLGAGLVVIFKDKQNLQVVYYAYLLVGLLLVFMPASLHPWYVILIIPFLAFFPNIAWLVFSCTVSLSYLKYVSHQGVMPTWVLMAEYLPLFGLLAAGVIIKKCKLRSRFTDMIIAAKTNK